VHPGVKDSHVNYRMCSYDVTCHTPAS